MNDKKQLSPMKFLIGGMLGIALLVSIMLIVVVTMPVEHPYVAARDLTAEVNESDKPTSFAPCEMHDSETGEICDGQAFVISHERELAYVFKHGAEISGGGEANLLA